MYPPHLLCTQASQCARTVRVYGDACLVLYLTMVPCPRVQARHSPATAQGGGGGGASSHGRHTQKTQDRLQSRHSRKFLAAVSDGLATLRFFTSQMLLGFGQWWRHPLVIAATHVPGPQVPEPGDWIPRHQPCGACQPLGTTQSTVGSGRAMAWGISGGWKACGCRAVPTAVFSPCPPPHKRISIAVVF